MIKVNPYLNFPGTTEEAFNFYKSIFGGEFAMIQRFKETEEADKLSAEEGEKIMHIALPVGSDTILMATDTLESMGQSVTNGNNFHLSISTESKAETERIFKALSAGGQVTGPLENTFWGAYFGMLTDKYGVQWMVSFDPNYQ